MKRILLLLLPFLPYLASAQVAKDTVTVLTIADIPAAEIRDTTNFTFVQDNAFKKATFDSLYKYTRVKLLATGAITSAELAGALSDGTGTGAAVFATSPVLTTPNLGTPSAATLTNATGLPIATGLTGLGGANRIPYATSATALATNANFVYSSGNLGLGIASPSNALHIRKDQQANTQLLVENLATGAGTTVRAGFTFTANDRIMSALALNNDAIYIGSASNHSLYLMTNSGTKLSVGTNGNVEINNQVPNFPEKLYVVGNIAASAEIRGGGTADNGAYNIQSNGTGVWGAGAYVNGSDISVKENVENIDSALYLVNALTPVKYNYKEDFVENNKKQVGFIAQDVYSVLTGMDIAEAIISTDGEVLGMAYSALIPLLTKAIQEQQQQIEALKARITQLENK